MTCIDTMGTSDAHGALSDSALTDVEVAVFDAAIAEELAEDLGFHDDPAFAQRYYAYLLSRRQPPR